MLKTIDKTAIKTKRTQAFDAETLTKTQAMLNDIATRGDVAILEYATQFNEIQAGDAILVTKPELKKAYDQLSIEDQQTLSRTATHIKTFAQAQLECLKPLSVPIMGGHAGHDFLPVGVAGCYAPGGRYPLPSSVLMTAIPAKVAGVETVIVVSPKPTLHTLAAAYLAGADFFLKIGGVQAIGALAYGTMQTPEAHVIVGPGNRWVTAAKQCVSLHTGIDMLAGPSELLVLADELANPKIIAADLLAQAEHDDDALPILITTSKMLVERVNEELKKQLITLPTQKTAINALNNGYAVVTETMNEAIELCNIIAPEHLQILTADADTVSQKITNCGGLFIGEYSAEVVGDYGAGPNHTLPTGGTATYKAGLSVLNFLRARTWINIKNPKQAQQLYEDAAKMGRIEGLEAHARAAELRSIK